MSSDAERCAVCGTPNSGWVEGNCPTCLMRLGTPTAQGKPPDAHQQERASPQPSPPSDGGEGVIRKLGNYEILEEIARGGMGAVYRARQVNLKRLVAVKVLLAAEFANETSRLRFRREAEAAASLTHPNIVSIYEVGEHDGQPYFAMELIEGRSLAEVAREKPVSARQAAQWLKMIAEAVHFAHERGVHHRDLKPSNVLVDGLNVPHITDFGLAKLLEPCADLTLSGQVLGTPSYMPPEQADPKRGQTTAASDVYSLGAVLYHLLTARPPFMAETLTQTLRLVAEGEAVSPRLLNPAVPRDLETICIKCLEKEPKRRYATAQELAEELGRFLKGEPIRARPITPVARLARWCRRKPALAISLGAVASLLLTLAIGFPLAFVRINRARQLAEAAHAQTQQQLYTALLEQARATVRSGELGQRVRTLDAVGRAAAITNTAELRSEAFAALALPDMRLEREIAAGSDITLAQLDPTFERIALCRGVGPVEIRAVSDQHLLATLPASTNLEAYAALWSSDGRFLAVKRSPDDGRSHKEIEVCDLASGRRLLLLHDAPRGALAFHPHEERVLADLNGVEVGIWDLKMGAEIKRFSLADTPVHLRFSPDGKRFAAEYHSITNDLISVYDAETGKLQSSTYLTEMVRDIDWDPRDRWIAFADVRGDVGLTDLESGQIRTLGRHKLEAWRTVFSPEGDYLFSGTLGQEMICWDLRLMQRAFTAGIQSSRLQFRADGRECAIRTPKAVQRFSFESPAALRELNAEMVERLHRGTFSRDGRWLVVTGRDRLGMWDWAADPAPVVKAYAEAAALTADPDHAVPFFTPDNSELFAFWNDGIGHWRLRRTTNASGSVDLDPLPVNKSRRLYSSFIYSNDLVLTGQGGLEFMDLTNATSPGRVYDDRAAPGTASPDGRWLILGRERLLAVHPMQTAEQIKGVFTSADILKFTFAPGSDELAVATSVGVEFYDATTWQRARLLPMPMDRYANLIFAPDGRTLWVSRDTRVGALYDTRTLDLVLTLPTGTLPLAVSPEGRNLALSVDGRRLQVWDLVELRRQLRVLGVDWDSARPVPAKTFISGSAIGLKVPVDGHYTTHRRVRALASDGGLVLIPAGSYLRGNFVASKGSGDADITDAPQYSVYVSAFLMDSTLVSGGKWNLVKEGYADAHGYVFENAGSFKGSSHPVQTVNWLDAVKWCNARSQMEGVVPVYYTSGTYGTVLKTGTAASTIPYVKPGANGYRLPTEAEWEKAARGGLNNNRFPWGTDHIEDYYFANYYGDTADFPYDLGPNGYNALASFGGLLPFTTPVQAMREGLNAYNLYDMAGNVHEWCWDWYGASYYAAGQSDPQGPSSGSGRVLRGGSWNSRANYLRCANRWSYTPSSAYDDWGFRSVKGVD